MGRRAAVLLIGAFLPACASAPVDRPETPVPLHAGQRVRVTLSNRFAPAPLVGTVEAVSPDTLVVRRETGGVRRLSRAVVERVEASVARERDPSRAAGEAILAGAPLLIPLGVVLVLAHDEIGYGGELSFLLPLLIVPVAVLATTGAVIGGGPQDVWVEATWPPGGVPSAPGSPTDATGGAASDSVPSPPEGA